MLLKLYEYKTCSTCQKAIKFLEAHEIRFERISIVDQPPSLPELKKMLEFIKAEGGTFKKLFNTSGLLYRDMKMAEKLEKGMTEKEALDLLAKHGKMIKRPFLLSPRGGVVGFQQEAWSQLLQAQKK